MDDLISRQAAIDAFGELATFTEDWSCHTWMYTDDVYNAIKELPPIQPKRGRWIGKYPVTSVCSECGFLIHDSKVKVFVFCPNCGADMRGEPMDDLISRQAAIDALNSRKTAEQCEAGKTRNWTVDICVDMIKQLPPIQPTDNSQKLADEIASFKRHVKSDNSDYLTGYLCALSVVEGMIADMREVNHESN